jgi:hypothetical protein
MVVSRLVHGSAPSTVRVQIVLFETSTTQVWRLVAGTVAAARQALEAGVASVVEVAFGDCSDEPCVDLGDEGIRTHTAGMPEIDVSYDFFGENLGSAGGHNRLATGTGADGLLLLNPDTYPAPNLLVELLDVFGAPDVGIVEGRQIPAENPKVYDPVTGDTPWAAGCCMLVSRHVFELVSGFDAELLPLYCDDVDLSWRVRLAGYRVVYAPRAAVFHDKRLRRSADAVRVVPARTEPYWGVLARLLMATKWARPDVVSATIDAVEANGTPEQRRALAEYQSRRAAGTLPDAELDGAPVVDFTPAYADQRF